MASPLHQAITEYTLERGLELDETYSLTPTRTGSNTNGTFSLNGIAPVYESTVGPSNGRGSWKFTSPKTGTGASGPSFFRVTTGASTTDLAGFSDNDWTVGFWFRLNNKITSQYNIENEIEIFVAGAFRIGYSSSLWTGGANRFVYSTDGSSWTKMQSANDTAVEANRWYYLAVRRVGSTWTFYIDGTAVRTLTNATTITPGTFGFGSGNTLGANASADMTWNVSNLHYGTATNLDATAISKIWEVGRDKWKKALFTINTTPTRWYKLDETGTTDILRDSSSNAINMDLTGSHGTEFSRVTAANAVDGYGLELGSTFAGYDTNGGTISFGSNFSFGFMFKKASAPASNTQWIYMNYNTDSNIAGTSQAKVQTNGYMVIAPKINGLQISDIGTGKNVCDNQWHFIVITRSGSTYKFYTDGVETGSATGNTWTTPMNNFNFGLASSQWDEFFWIDQTLTAQQVTDLYNATPFAAISINYTNTTGATASATSPDAVISLTTNRNIAADPMITATPHADFIMPGFSTSSPITIDPGVSTASAESVMPTISLGTNLNAFGVSIASADIVNPTTYVEKSNNYSHTVATASGLFTDATITTTKAVSYSASPITASALLSGNVYAGPTVEDTTYSVSIRQIGETTNTDGKNGFSIGSQYTNSTLDARTSVAFKANSGVPTNGALIKVKLNPTHVSASQVNNVRFNNAFNVYVFTAAPSTTFSTMTYANLPAKELLYTTRSNDSDGQYLDLTRAFVDSRSATYGVFIEHVGEPPYSSTQYDRTEYSGTNLEDKLFYILTSEFTNVNYNSAVMTATGLFTDATVAAQKYVDYAHSVATATGNIVAPTIVTERTVTVSALELAASVQAVQPAFKSDTSYTSDHLEAFAEGLAFIVSATKNVNVLVDANTVTALLHMPGASIGEDNLVSDMVASALFVMPAIGLSSIVIGDKSTASALFKDPAITTQLRGTVKADPMTVRAFSPLPPKYFDYTTDKWFKSMYDFPTTQLGSYSYPFIKFFTMTSNVLSNSLPTGSPSFVDRILLSASDPAGTFSANKPFFADNRDKLLAWSNGQPGQLEVGYFDEQNRTAARINNILFSFRNGVNQPTGTYPNPGSWVVEMKIKATKQNQVLLGDGPRFLGLSGSGNNTHNMGLYNGKFFSTFTISGPGLDDPAYKAFAWDPTYGAGTTSPYAETFVGNKVIADGQWHHIVIQRYGNRLQVFVDGQLDIQRYTNKLIYPSRIGFGGWSADADSDFYISAISLVPNQILSDRQIDINYAYASGFNIYEAEPMTASLAAPQNVKARGNRPRALALYWWPNRRAGSGVIERQEDLWDGQSGYPNVEFDTKTFFTLDTYNTKSQKFYGWDAYAVDITGNYYSEVVNYNSYSGGVQTVDSLIGRGPGVQKVTISGRGFRDPVTDNRRLIDLINDIDLDQVEAIFFLNYPDQSREVDEYLRDEVVDDFFNIREKDIYQDFLKGLRAAVDKGISLMVSNAQLAIDLGIIDRVEIVDPLIDGITYVRDGAQDGTRMPEIAISSTDFNNDIDRAIALVPGASGKSTDRDGNWQDTSYNNRLRIVNTLPGVTDLMYFTLEDYAYFAPNGQYRYGAPPELYTKLVYNPNGAPVGKEFIMPDRSNMSPGHADFARRYLAVPFANVKAGKIVAAFANNYYRKNQLVENPYKNYATHIALEKGTNLNGRPLGGRIWVTITERPQLSTGSYSQVELSTDYWINLAFNLGIITASEKTTYLNRVSNLDRQLARGAITQAQYDKATYWSELGYNQTTTVSSALGSLADQAVASIGKLFEAIFTKAQKSSAEEAGLSSLFSYSGTGIIAMVQNYYSEPKAALPTVSLNGAAFGWLADRTVYDGIVIREPATTASAVMIDPVVVANKVLSTNAQAMIATATQVDPTNIIWTQKNNNYVSLPMTASALINPKLTLILAEAMTASAQFKENIGAIVTQVDEVILYINHVDPILYLREDVVK